MGITVIKNLNPLIPHKQKNTALFYYCCTLLLVIVFFSGISCRQSIPKKQGFLYLRLNTNPTTLDPALIVDVTGASIGAKIFNGLVRFDKDLSLKPDLAERWEISADGKTYTFFLQHGIRFSNGREVTADDVKYSFERVLNPATRSPRTWVFDRIQGAQEFMKKQAQEVSGITVKDSRTLIIHLSKPFGPFLSLLTVTTAAVVPKEEVEKWGADFSFHVVGTGPFMLQEWQHSRHLCLAANPRFFRSPPRIKGIVYRIIPEDLTAMVEFEIGNLDIIRIPAAEFHKYRTNTGKYSINEQPGLNTYYLGLNCRQKPLTDVRVRQAIYTAIDRERIRTTIFEKRGLLASGPVPPLLRKSFPKLKDSFPYDPERARELLKQAGYPEGFPLTITITALPEVLDIVEVIQQYLKKIGITVTIHQLEWSSFKEMVARGKAQAFWLSWWADYPDAENFLFPLFHSSNWGAGGNRSFYQNPTVDRAIEQAQQEPEETTRIRLFHKAEETIIQDAPVVFFWHQTDYYLSQPSVKNFIPSPLTTSEDGTDFLLKATTYGK